VFACFIYEIFCNFLVECWEGYDAFVLAGMVLCVDVCLTSLTTSYDSPMKFCFPTAASRRAQFPQDINTAHTHAPAHISLSAQPNTYLDRYNVDSLLTRYRGVDWRQNRDLPCNARRNPQGEQMNDGLGLDPFEVVFIKAKGYPRVATTQVFLSRYTDYALGRDDLTTNDFNSPRVQVVIEQERALLKARVLRCGATFDAEFYFKYNPDLAGAVEMAHALNHFNDYGFAERRPYRYESSWRKSRDKGCRWD